MPTVRSLLSLSRTRFLNRVITVSDAIDSIYVERFYRKGCDTETVIGILEEGSAHQFDSVRVE